MAFSSMAAETITNPAVVLAGTIDSLHLWSNILPAAGRGGSDLSRPSAAAGEGAVGLGGNDTLVAFGGNDTLIGGTGGDTMNGGSGVDTVRYDNSIAAVHVGLSSGEAWGGDATGDVLVQIENLAGSQFDDALYGNNVANRIEGGNSADLLYGYGGDDTLYGGNFGDRLIGGAGADLLNGGDGFDTADYGASAQGVLIDLTNHQTSGGDAEGDTLVSIEKVIGSGQGDSLLGDGAANFFFGSSGNDRLYGRGGADYLDGGPNRIGSRAVSAATT